jgi:flavin-binding protein dodecin
MEAPLMKGDFDMSNNMVKVIEVLAESDKSWEDAAAQAIEHAGRTLHGIKSIYIEHFEAAVDSNRIVKYRINAKISFLLD